MTDSPGLETSPGGATAAPRGTGGDRAVRVGVDVVDVDEVRDSMTRFGERYVRRVFTAHEVDSCGSSPQGAAAGLAARFAAKEATLKVLRPDGYQPDWRSIEVRRHGPGWCSLELHDGAASLASAAGIDQLAVSLSHQGNVAAAVVVALCASPDDDVAPLRGVTHDACAERSRHAATPASVVTGGRAARA